MEHGALSRPSTAWDRHRCSSWRPRTSLPVRCSLHLLWFASSRPSLDHSRRHHVPFCAGVILQLASWWMPSCWLASHFVQRRYLGTLQPTFVLLWRLSFCHPRLRHPLPSLHPSTPLVSCHPILHCQIHSLFRSSPRRHRPAPSTAFASPTVFSRHFPSLVAPFRARPSSISAAPRSYPPTFVYLVHPSMSIHHSLCCLRGACDLFSRPALSTAFVFRLLAQHHPLRHPPHRPRQPS